MAKKVLIFYFQTYVYVICESSLNSFEKINSKNDEEIKVYPLPCHIRLIKVQATTYFDECFVIMGVPAVRSIKVPILLL